MMAKAKKTSRRKDTKPNLVDQVNERAPELDCQEQVRLLRRDLAAEQRKSAKRAAGMAEILAEVRDILDGQQFVVDIPKRPAKDRRSKREEAPVLCLGDIHGGYYWPDGEHAYSVAIAKSRVHRAIDKFTATVNDRRHSAKIEEVRLYVLGDIVEGENMRPGHPHGIEGSVLKQAVFWMPELLSSVVLRLLTEFRKIRFVAVPGNHGRNGPPKTDSHPQTNWDRVAYQTTRHIVEKAILQARGRTGGVGDRRDDVVWDLPTDRDNATEGDSWFAIDYVFDWCNCLLHGEDLRGKGWGGLPFYGIERMTRRYADIVNDPIDFMFLGHVHTDATIPSNFRTVYVNGAVESSTTYARKQLVSATHPSQKAVFFAADHGPLSVHTLWLTEDRRPHGTRITRALAKRNQ